jgi:hypothetical protein
MTHDELVAFSIGYARKLGFPLALAELVTANRTGEIPDVLAFRGGGDSLLIECKVSRTDFLRDKYKPFRMHPEMGMGMYRMYVTAPGVLMDGELADRWLAVEVDGSEIVKLTAFGSLAVDTEHVFGERNMQAELACLYSYIRRMKERA